MPVKIRLARYRAERPFYRVVVTDSRFPRDGRYLEVVGTYNPRNKASGLNLKVQAIQEVNYPGAEVSDTVRKLLRNSVRTAGADQ